MTSQEASKLSEQAMDKYGAAKAATSPNHGRRTLYESEERDAYAAARYFRELAIQLRRQGK